MTGTYTEIAAARVGVGARSPLDPVNKCSRSALRAEALRNERVDGEVDGPIHGEHLRYARAR
jgi:hypothetical protein